MEHIFHHDDHLSTSPFDELQRQLHAFGGGEDHSFGATHDSNFMPSNQMWEHSSSIHEEHLVQQNDSFSQPFDMPLCANAASFAPHATSLQFDSATTQAHHLSIDNIGGVSIDGANYGHIDGHHIYNRDNHYVGYWTNDGNIYDCRDHLQGAVHPDGSVYATSANGNLDLQYHADRGAAEGGAYVLLYWCGGQTD